MSLLRLGIIGLDTSHVTAFTNLLHTATDPNHVAGGKVVAAFPGGSPDFPISIDRVPVLQKDMEEKFGVPIVNAIADMRGKVDAILLESVDGRVHLEQFSQIADWGVPVFIDKPLAVCSKEARAIAELAEKHGTRVMTSSALRFATPLREALADTESGAVVGGDFYGPMAFQEKAPGFYWYGIHSVEMLFAVMGADWKTVEVIRNGDYDLIIGVRSDGAIGTVRGNRTGNNSFGGTIHREKRSQVFDVSTASKPFYASLLEQVIPFLKGEQAPVSLCESVKVIRFLEAANEAVETGKKVTL